MKSLMPCTHRGSKTHPAKWSVWTPNQFTTLPPHPTSPPQPHLSAGRVRPRPQHRTLEYNRRHVVHQIHKGQMIKEGLGGRPVVSLSLSLLVSCLFSLWLLESFMNIYQRERETGGERAREREM